MDEPQIANPVDETAQAVDVEMPEAALEGGNDEILLDSANPLEVTDPAEVIPEASFVEPEKIDSVENDDHFHDASEDIAGDISQDASMTELGTPDQTVEHIDFDKPENLDESEAAPSSSHDTLDFAERSINISQLDVGGHNDDSNDAFNALKEAETDALHTPKEEVEEPKDPDIEIPIADVTAIADTSDEAHDVEDALVIKPVESPMETDEKQDEEIVDKEKDPSSATEVAEEPSTSEVSAETAPVDLIDEDSVGAGEKSPASVDKGVGDDEVEEIPDDESTTTNNGEGVDEDVCLLGDAEREISDADKERAVQSQEETVEDEEASKDDELPAIVEEDDDDVMEVDAESTEKEAEEPEAVETDQTDSVPLKENEIRELATSTEQTCLNCENTAECFFEVLEESGDVKHLCTFNCVKEHREDNPDKYSLTQKKVQIHEIPPAEELCSKCNETKSCKYRYRITESTTVTKEPPAPAEGEAETPEGEEVVVPQPITETVQTTVTKFICEQKCLDELIDGNTDKFVVNEVKRRSVRVRELPKRVETVESEVPKIAARSDAEVEAARLDREASFVRRCAQCFEIVHLSAKSINWETFDFCDELCVSSYQNLIGANCTTCFTAVSLPNIGKLCVRFGLEIKQFCCSACLDVYKKALKNCGYCLSDLGDREDIVLAQVGEKKVYKDFCNEICLRRYEDIVNPKKKSASHLCSVCNKKKTTQIEVLLDDNVHRFCSSACLSAFKFVNNVSPDQCDMCAKYFERKSADAHTINCGSNDSKIFCTRFCMNIFISTKREILQCDWCKVSKYNFDMLLMKNSRMCSVNCLKSHEASTTVITKKKAKCAQCKLAKQLQYTLNMSDATTRTFCVYQCVMQFMSQFSKRTGGEGPSVVPAGTAKRIKANQAMPVIARVQSLNLRNSRQPYNPITNRSGSPIPVPELTVQLERLSDLPSRVKVSSLGSLIGGGNSYRSISPSRSMSPPVRTETRTQVVTIPPLPKQISNKSTMCKSIMLNKAINCTVTTAEVECQTDDWLEQRVIVPVPIPVFIPQPMYMYNMPTPIPVPIPLPIPVPIFIPTTRNSASGIMKEIKKIQEKMPTDPYEAELLMMAEMVAGDKKREETDSESDTEVNNEMEYGDGIENNSSFNEDLVQMAFKMAGDEFNDPPVDLENEMTANTISQNSAYGDDMDPHSLHHHQLLLLQQQRDAAAAISGRGRKRIQQPKPTNAANNRNNTPNKRIKREMEVMQPEMPREPAEKPDANMCLKYTFGVNAWKQWVATKNADYEKSSIRRKPIKSEILQLTADELNYSLCMFVKEVRKPNGSEYAPDTIYYLVLGIQQYLYENGRIDNIFTDRYYEQFTDCLDEVAKKFSVLYNDSQYIVTRVEEEHLWECKQLGAHSPHVLLSTLMFFNTKHFNLVTVDEHMELSFSHIMKHWKRNPNQPGAAKIPGSRNVLLRFYPPQSSLAANSRKKKVYEQQENEENPLRCPVKLYEFYLSKCPESVKTRNDVFYLQPERSCVPDSPVWYSTQPLSRDALSKMLHRVKMVKEINIALLTS